jgi:hypothetical protein
MPNWIPVENSGVEAYYITASGAGDSFCDVIARFHDGAVYRYFDIPEKFAQEFIDSPSKRRYIMIGFRPYRHERVREEKQ